MHVDLLFDPFGGRWEDLRDAAVLAEEAGFDGVWLYDHLAGSAHRAPHVLECWTVLSALAAVVPQLAIGPLVLNVANRDPGTLAVMAATLQEVSGGRLLLGVGAGGGAGTPYAAEQLALGRSLSARRRRPAGRGRGDDRHAARRCGRARPAGSVGFLRPVPPPPVIVGGFGPKMAELAGRLGDGINAPAGPSLPRLLDIARTAHAAAGGDPDTFVVTTSGSPTDDRLARPRRAPGDHDGPPAVHRRRRPPRPRHRPTLIGRIHGATGAARAGPEVQTVTRCRAESAMPLVSIITPVLPDADDHLRRGVPEHPRPASCRPAGAGSGSSTSTAGRSRTGSPDLGDRRVHVSADGHNQGAALTRNMLVSRSSGTYLKVLDADDQLAPGVLSRDLAVVTAHPEVMWVTSRARDLLDDGTLVEFPGAPAPGLLEVGSVFRAWMAARLPVLDPPGDPVRRAGAVLALGGWTAVSTSEDTGLLLALNCREQGFFSDEVGLTYRKWPKQLTGQASTSRRSSAASVTASSSSAARCCCDADGV